MIITAEQVAKLRERTGAGMMDCKKALTENAGDFEKAIIYVKKGSLGLLKRPDERQRTEPFIRS